MLIGTIVAATLLIIAAAAFWVYSYKSYHTYHGNLPRLNGVILGCMGLATIAAIILVVCAAILGW